MGGDPFRPALIHRKPLHLMEHGALPNAALEAEAVFQKPLAKHPIDDQTLLSARSLSTKSSAPSIFMVCRINAPGTMISARRSLMGANSRRCAGIPIKRSTTRSRRWRVSR